MLFRSNEETLKNSLGSFSSITNNEEIVLNFKLLSKEIAEKLLAHSINLNKSISSSSLLIIYNLTKKANFNEEILLKSKIISTLKKIIEESYEEKTKAIEIIVNIMRHNCKTIEGIINQKLHLILIGQISENENIRNIIYMCLFEGNDDQLQILIKDKILKNLFKFEHEFMKSWVLHTVSALVDKRKKVIIELKNNEFKNKLKEILLESNEHNSKVSRKILKNLQ